MSRTPITSVQSFLAKFKLFQHPFRLLLVLVWEYLLIWTTLSYQQPTSAQVVNVIHAVLALLTLFYPRACPLICFVLLQVTDYVFGDTIMSAASTACCFRLAYCLTRPMIFTLWVWLLKYPSAKQRRQRFSTDPDIISALIRCSSSCSCWSRCSAPHYESTGRKLRRNGPLNARNTTTHG